MLGPVGTFVTICHSLRIHLIKVGWLSGKNLNITLTCHSGHLYPLDGHYRSFAITVGLKISHTRDVSPVSLESSAVLLEVCIDVWNGFQKEKLLFLS